MGGGTSTEQTTSVVSRQIAESFVKNIMNCTSAALVNQSFKIEGDGNIVSGAKMVQNFKLSSSCTQNAQNIANIQQSLSNTINQTAETQGVALLGALGNVSSDQRTIIENEVRSKVTQETIQNIISTTNAQQEFVIKGDNNIVKDFSMEQTMELLIENAQQVINKMDSVQQIDNAVKQSGKTTQTNPISDILNSLFDGLTQLASVWVILLIVCLLFAFLFREPLGKIVMLGLKFTPMGMLLKDNSKEKK